MPQGRKKTPFSGKQKKSQLLAKRQTKGSNNRVFLKKPSTHDSDDSENDNTNDLLSDNVQKLNVQPSNRNNANRFVLQFHRETEKELRDMKIEARSTLINIPEKELEIDDDYFVGYDFPIRPGWNYEMKKETLNGNENRYFTQYIQKLEAKHLKENKHLSYCELNLETWRQLWRVLELSDIVLMIVDIRYPTLMFPPSLYDYVVNDLGKQMILVLNKIDLAPPSIVLSWKKYFERKYNKINVVMFTSFPSYNLRKNHGNKNNTNGMQIRRRRGKMKMAAEGAQQVLESCKLMVNGAVDLTSWEEKIDEEIKSLATNNVGGNDIDDNEEDDDLVVTEGKRVEEMDFDFQEHIPFKDGVLTVGCVGFPNVGKSSLLNALMGRKVVSVSRTPGHTKHFQTIFLTKNVRLCDCPGLVFPSSAPRKIQVLMGSYPIAQLKEPYGSIKFMAERQNLQNILNIQHPEGKNEEWSALDICDGWAIKRGFLTAKAGRPDTYRAANNLLRMSLEGKLTICFRPIGFFEEKLKWEKHPELCKVETIQALGKDDIETKVENKFFSSDDEDDNNDEDIASVSSVPIVRNAFALLNSDDDDD